MEIKYKPELVLNRKVCQSCGESIFEFSPDMMPAKEYICTDCSVIFA